MIWPNQNGVNFLADHTTHGVMYPVALTPSPSLFRSQRNTIGISTVAAATINAPEVIFYKPSRSPQTNLWGFMFK